MFLCVPGPRAQLFPKHVCMAGASARNPGAVPPEGRRIHLPADCDGHGGPEKLRQRVCERASQDLLHGRWEESPSSELPPASHSPAVPGRMVSVGFYIPVTRFTGSSIVFLVLEVFAKNIITNTGSLFRTIWSHWLECREHSQSIDGELVGPVCWPSTFPHWPCQGQCPTSLGHDFVHRYNLLEIFSVFGVWCLMLCVFMCVHAVCVCACTRTGMCDAQRTTCRVLVLSAACGFLWLTNTFSHWTVWQSLLRTTSQKPHIIYEWISDV